MIDKLNQLINVPMEQWHKRGVDLKAVSANANGRVNSGLVGPSRIHFYRVGSGDKSRFKLGGTS